MIRPIGVVLAGGAGKRFGQPKGEALFEARTWATRAAETLARVCDGVVISVRPGGANPAPGFTVIEDAPPGGCGPLAGILSAFDSTASSDLLVLACDYTWVDAQLLGQLLALAPPGADWIFPVDLAGRDHPLVGLWRRGLADRVRGAVHTGQFAVRTLIDRSRVRRVLPHELGLRADDRRLTNVNRAEDLVRDPPRP